MNGFVVVEYGNFAQGEQLAIVDGVARNGRPRVSKWLRQSKRWTSFAPLAPHHGIKRQASAADLRHFGVRR